VSSGGDVRSKEQQAESGRGTRRESKRTQPVPPPARIFPPKTSPALSGSAEHRSSKLNKTHTHTHTRVHARAHTHTSEEEITRASDE